MRLFCVVVAAESVGGQHSLQWILRHSSCGRMYALRYVRIRMNFNVALMQQLKFTPIVTGLLFVTSYARITMPNAAGICAD